MTQSSDYSHDPICRLCGIPYDNHLRCQCCRIFCGPNHFNEGVSHYRGKALCDLCIEEWKALEERVGYKIPWEMALDRNKYYRPDGQLREEARR